VRLLQGAHVVTTSVLGHTVCTYGIKMTEDQAFENLKAILLSVPDLKLRVPVASLQMNQVLRRDLGFDSIVLFSVLMELETQFPHITEEEAAKWITLHDCVKSMVRV
jgi:acyl carrier protein